MIEVVTVEGRPILLDEILARVFGPQDGRDLVSAALELNPHLATLGRRIPIGTVIRLPPKPMKRAAPVRVVSLFG